MYCVLIVCLLVVLKDTDSFVQYIQYFLVGRWVEYVSRWFVISGIELLDGEVLRDGCSLVAGGGDTQRRAPAVLRLQQAILWQEQEAAPVQPRQHSHGREALPLPLLPPQGQPQG